MKLFDSWHLTFYNYIIFAAGISLIIIGYFLMSIGTTEGFLATKLSPIILVIGYCVIIPLSLILNFNKKKN